MSPGACSSLVLSVMTLPDANETASRILVVDDHATTRLKMTLAIRKIGHDVESADDGRKALQILRDGSIDLMLLDLLMPELDGFEVLEILKGDPKLRGIPVIVISSISEMRSVVKAIELGAEDYLPKDFDPILFKARIQSCLEKKRLRDREVAVLTQRSEAEKTLRKVAEHAQFNLSRYFSPNLANQLARDPKSLDLSGERRELSFVFTDLADFTPLVEQLDPAAIISILNNYLDGITRIVFKHEGTMDKVVGDAVHAMFGAPLAQPNHPKLAVGCALEIDHFCEDFRKRQNESNGVPLGVTRIGVHTGPAIVGNFGGELYFDYTAHGEAINTVARLESVNKHFGTRICVSETVVSKIPNFNGRPVGYVVLKGTSTELKVYEPLGHVQATARSTQSYREAYELLEASDPKASQAFAAVVGEYGEDPLSIFHLKRLLTGECNARIAFSEK